MKKRTPRQTRITPYKETHQEGNISIEFIPESINFYGDFGIQIASDGKVWICINGKAFIRFHPDIIQINAPIGEQNGKDRRNN